MLRSILSVLLACSGAIAQSDTAFTYQGLLAEGGAPANGEYNVDVTLWDADVRGSQQGPEIEFNAHPVTDGRLTLDLDFGDRMMIPDTMWIEISVNGSELSPRQPLSSAPVSIRTCGINVDPDSDAGIGTAQPQAMLHIDGTATDYGVLRLVSPGASSGSIEFNSPRGQMGLAATAPNGKHRDIWFMDDGLGLFTSDTGDSPFAGDGLFIDSRGRVGVGTTQPVWDFHVAGNSWFDGAVRVLGGLEVETPGLSVLDGYPYVDSDNLWASHSISNAVGGNYWAIGFYGEALQNHGSSAGVYGHSASNEGSGVFGIASATVGTTYGARGWADSTEGSGVFGYADATSGNAIALLAQTNSSAGYSGYFIGPSGSQTYFQQSVGIGVLNPGYQLQLSANSAAKPTSDRWTISSDERLKKHIEPIDHPLDDLLRLRGVTYQWREPASQGGMTGTYTGMIAQEVERVFPEWVGEDAQGYKTLTITGFEGVVVEAMRELRDEKDAEIAALSRRLAQRESEIEHLSRRLAALERAVLLSTQTEGDQ